jgi:general secretion pathway protein J
VLRPLRRPAPARAAQGGDSGFTLVEVMIALAIFAMIASAGVAILAFSMRAGAAADARLDGSAALARTVSILSADFAQAVDRPTRDEGGVARPAFVGETGASVSPMLALVRGGWSDLDGAPRPGLQKVAWLLDRGALQRVVWPQLDGAAPLAPATLMTGVVDVRLRYRLAGAWSDRWDAGRTGAALPQAAEVTIVRRDGTSWRELFPVGNGAPPTPTPTASATARAS